MTALQVDPHRQRIAWIEAERIRRQEREVYEDTLPMTYRRRRDLADADTYYREKLRRER